MTRFKYYQSGQLFGIRYTFEYVGDGLPSHAHQADLAHNVMVVKGRVRMSIADEQRELSAGDVLDFDWTKPHYMVALEPDSAVVNLLLHGQGMQMPAEREGSFNVTQEELRQSISGLD